MAVLGNVIGFGAFGVAARAWQLGIQKRNLFQTPGAYLLSGGVFGAIGYWLVGVEERQVELITQKRKELGARRNPAQTL
ncbi:unnamed protein product [Rhizoctonia solani]|uniref:NADH-ubiquinone oxidoreductase 14 kDa subunit n=1 Tax=Rhizoctonia solani TaxID=456999 RepID=A0A8H3A128_9AGAM|nr:unnamed protein product [Rhizoctonia solani]